MQPTIQTLTGLERRVDLTVAAGEIEQEVARRLAQMARNVRMPGFRPGKVPLKMVAATYGAQIQSEVLNDKVGAAFSQAVESSRLRVVGPPRLEPRAGAAEGSNDLAFTATFEIYPEIRLADLSTLPIAQATCSVGEADVDRTIDIMRRQRATFQSTTRGAQVDDRVTVDFSGSIDGKPFDGGAANGFTYVVGQGRMLPEFEAAVIGMTPGTSKSFNLRFPDDYRGREVAGRLAVFDLRLNQVDEPLLPPLDAAFAKQLGVDNGDLTQMRAEVRANLEREVARRLRARTRDSVMQTLLAATHFDVPKALVEADQQQLAESARTELAGRGSKEEPPPASAFAATSERRVRLGLVVAEVVRAEGLQARQDQVRKAIEEIAQSYEKPAEVVQWYLGNRDRVSEVENSVVEDNLLAWVLQRGRVVQTPVAFDELMGHR